MKLRLNFQHFTHLCMTLFLLTSIGITSNVQATWLYKGLWFIYGSPTNMHIMAETTNGVDPDSKHRYLTSTQSSSCNAPYFGYNHRDISVNNADDRRVWDMYAHDLTPGCVYKVTFHYRPHTTDLWHETTGKFNTAHEITPSDMGFYGFGDQRMLDNEDEINLIAQRILDQTQTHTFILNTGDLAYQGGYPINSRDYWEDYFDVDNVKNGVLIHMPMLTTPGNHDIDNGEGSKTGDSTNYSRYFPYAPFSSKPSTQYYYKHYPPVHIFSLTSYPMDLDSEANYCTARNDNYRPLSEGGTGQYEWLEAKLKDIDDSVDQWKVAMMHAPIYSPDACNNQDDAKTYLVPLFEKYGVDLFVSGHNHYYAYKPVNDVHYFILGGAGAPLSGSGCDTNSCNGFDPAHVAYKHHYVYFHVMGDIMYASVYDERANRFDYITIDKTPKADFDTKVIYSSGRMQFTDKSTGNRYKYKWDFGDGKTKEGTGSDATTLHDYYLDGKYTVTLTVWSHFGNNTKTCTNCVVFSPIADFQGYGKTGKKPRNAEFEDWSFWGISGITDYLWDFGDGTTSTDQDPPKTQYHQYNENGRYTVKLTVSSSVSNMSNTMTKTDWVKVEPYADFQYTISMLCLEKDSEGRCVDWRYHTEFENTSGGSDLTYLWDMGGGWVSHAENPSWNFGDLHRIKLTVTDGAGDTDFIAKYLEYNSELEPAVDIDIMPSSDTNTIEITKHGRIRPEIIRVAILSDASFDAFDLDTKTVTFGRIGNEASLKNCNNSAKDINGDGLKDLTCHFDGKQTDFKVGDSEGILRGMTKEGRHLEGKDTIQVIAQ